MKKGICIIRQRSLIPIMPQCVCVLYMQYQGKGWFDYIGVGTGGGKRSLALPTLIKEITLKSPEKLLHIIN